MLYLQQSEILRVSVAIAPVIAVALGVIPARAVTLEDLDGVNIDARASYTMHVRRAEGEFRPQLTLVTKVKLSEQGRIVGENVRTVATKAGPRTRSFPINGRIGMPGTPEVGGHALWVLDGDKLFLLRALEAGGFKAEITFKGSGKAMTCSFRAPYVREEGADKIKSQESVIGGPVTVISATQTASDCKLSR